jgi:hypothetical protein
MVCISLLDHAYNMLYSCHSSHSIGLIFEEDFSLWNSSASCNFLPLRYKHSPQHPVLEHPKSMLSELCKTFYCEEWLARLSIIKLEDEGQSAVHSIYSQQPSESGGGLLQSEPEGVRTHWAQRTLIRNSRGNLQANLHTTSLVWH